MISGERRAHPRIPFWSEVTIDTSAGRLSCRCADLARGGICLLPPTSAVSGSSLSRAALQLRLPLGQTDVDVQGQVVRVGQQAGQLAWGVAFHPLGAVEDLALESYVREELRRLRRVPASALMDPPPTRPSSGRYRQVRGTTTESLAVPRPEASPSSSPVPPASTPSESLKMPQSSARPARPPLAYGRPERSPTPTSAPLPSAPAKPLDPVEDLEELSKLYRAALDALDRRNDG